MKKQLLSIIAMAFVSLFASAQDVSIPISAVQAGWGWNTEFEYDVTNPNTTAGVGCTATTVTKVTITQDNAGSFGIADVSGGFAWSSITDFSPYSSIELLVYPEVAGSFNGNVSYKGWDNVNNANISSTVASIETTTLVPNEWQVITIDLSLPLVDDVDDQITYASLANMGLNNAQLENLGIAEASGSIYIGAITLKEGTVTPGEVVDKSLPLSVVQSGWGWNTTFEYNVANPNTTAGLGCDSSTVTKVSITKDYSGSFGLADVSGGFTWSSIANWTGYKSIEILVYPEIQTTFGEEASFKGWDNVNSANISSTVTAVSTDVLVANEWQLVTIDLTVPLVDDVDNQITYASLANMGLNNIQFQNLGIAGETGSFYIGGVTLTKREVTNDPNPPTSINTIETTVKVYPNPTSSVLTISSDVDVEGNVTVTNMLGVEVISTSNLTIDVSSLPVGLYVVTVPTSNGPVSQTIQVK